MSPMVHESALVMYEDLGSVYGVREKDKPDRVISSTINKKPPRNAQVVMHSHEQYNIKDLPPRVRTRNKSVPLTLPLYLWLSPDTQMWQSYMGGSGINNHSVAQSDVKSLF